MTSDQELRMACVREAIHRSSDNASIEEVLEQAQKLYNFCKPVTTDKEPN